MAAGRGLLRRSCEHCGGPLQRFGRCRRRTCPAYAPLWAGDWRKVIGANLELVEGVALITVTAPGADLGLAWDRSQCRHPEGVRCSGRLGCRVVQRAADTWHASHEERWARLHRAAAERARRRAGRGEIVVAKAWERQQRGVDHLHLVVAYRSWSERRRIEAYAAALKELAPKYWFGFVDLQRGTPGRGSNYRAAAYLAKYVGKAMLEQFAPHARRPFYVSQRLTRQTGVTMRRLRLKRYLYVRWGCDPLLPGERFHTLDLYFELTRKLDARPISARAP